MRKEETQEGEQGKEKGGKTFLRVSVSHDVELAYISLDPYVCGEAPIGLRPRCEDEIKRGCVRLKPSAPMHVC